MVSSASSLRVAVFGNGGLASLILQALEEDGVEVVAYCRRVRPAKRQLRTRIGALLRQLGLRRRDSFVYSDALADIPPPEPLARRLGAEMLSSKDLATPEFAARLRALQTDVIFVAGFHRLIPKFVIEAPRLAAVNFHPSLLPRHRGGTPCRWVVRNDERESGLSAHLLTETFDTGSIVGTTRFEVMAGEPAGAVERRAADRLQVMCRDVLGKIAAGELRPVVQDEAEATYEPSLRGALRALDWELSASDLRQICLAMQPRSGGMTALAGQPVCVWKGASESGGGAARPGTVIDIDERGHPLVACADGAFRLLEVLRHGRIEDASALLRRHGLKAGMTFDAAKDLRVV